MQLVSDLQQRPSKGRLKMEKSIVNFYDLCSLVQLVTLVIHTVTTTVSAKRTFAHNFFVNSDFALSPTLQYKTRDCVYNTTRTIYAFSNVQMSFTQKTVNDVFVDNAIQMRLAIFIMVTVLVLAVANRSCVENNVFYVKFRSFYLYKDIIAAAELLILGYVLQIALAAKPTSSLLSDYLKACGVKSHVYLPFITQNTLYVFVGVGYFSWVVGICLYLSNSLPKYGIMNASEIEEYKVWLRQRNADIAQSRALIEEAKKAHARLQIMQSTEYLGGPRGAGGAGVPLSMVPGVGGGPYPYNPAMMSPSPYPMSPYMNPYMEEMMRRGMLPSGYAAASLPPAQLYGAGMMPSAPLAGAYPPTMAQLEDAELRLRQQQQQTFQSGGPLAGTLGGGAGAGGMPNMPRRRTVAPQNGGPSRPPSSYPPPPQ